MPENPDADSRTGYGSAHDLPSFVEMRQQLSAFKALTFFVMRERRGEIVELQRELKEMADRIDAFYDLLGSRHWVYNDWMSVKTIDEILDGSSTSGEAEQRLIEMYQDTEASKWHLKRLRNLDGLRERQHLLTRAREDYDAGRFDACTLILISVMDGFVNDFEADKRKGLAAREADEMMAWDSITGHHMGLTNALKPFLKTIKKRIEEEVFEVHRHGIVHGSVVSYNNAVVATKAWNLLFAVVDWSVATKKQAKEESKPPAPTLRESFRSIVEYGRRKKRSEEFQPWTVSATASEFEDDGVVVVTRLFVEAWQKQQWGRLVPLMPIQLIGAKRIGEAAEYTKSWYEMHKISDVEIYRVEYTQSSVAEVRGTATIDGTTANLKLRWVFYDSNGDLALNDQEGSWQLAVIVPSAYLVNDGGERLK